MRFNPNLPSLVIGEIVISEIASQTCQVWHAISGLWQTLSLVAVSSRLASSVAVCLHRDGKYATLQFGPIQYESPIACNPKCIQGRIGTSAGRGDLGGRARNGPISY